MGDDKYTKQTTLDTQGQMLHAKKIEFIHPITKEKMEFEAEAPAIFTQTIEQLRREIQ